MKKSELPQDEGHLVNFTREVCYVKNDEGKYEADLSKGWQVKNDALDNAWNDINDRIEKAKNAVLTNEASPIVYFMEKDLMDLVVLTGYTGFWKWQVKRHLKPLPFQKLSEKKLKKYADAFGISVQELKSPSFS